MSEPLVADHVNRWKFALVTVAVWAVAGAAGAGLYHWWAQSPDKAVPVFAVLVYLVASIVVSLLAALVQDRPAVTALAIAFMSAPLAAAMGAVLLRGH
ncbi:MAG: hypothetical protein PGN37_02485 [Mycobacterium kyogaense]|uniref:hypothetical protein n=1 Tax=Mycobacterium kyogaense TaxID=2212479 RepID=UPI002FF7062F